MQDVSQMQFDGDEIPASNVYEINVIKKSFAHMKNGLQSFSKFLDHKVVLQMLKLGLCGCSQNAIGANDNAYTFCVWI